MLKVAEDESIHSFLYRAQVVNGVADFSNIITTSGRWISFPRVLNGTLHYYQPVDDLVFLKLLQAIGLAEKKVFFYNQGLSYRQDLQYFFCCSKVRGPSSHDNHAGFREIRYCLPCIKEHIKEFGYGVIKIDWSITEYCKLHKAPINTCNANSRKKAVDSLNEILRGENPFSYSISKKDNFSPFNHSSGFRQSTLDFFAPCLMGAFEKFVLNKFTFSESIAGENGSFDAHKAQLKPAPVMIRFYMVKAFNYLKQNQPLVFEKKWKKYVVKINISTGAINKDSISETIFKYAHSDCNKCEHRKCLANISSIP